MKNLFSRFFKSHKQETPKFRSEPTSLSEDEVMDMLKKHDFFDFRGNKNGRGFDNKFDVRIIKSETVVFDSASDLMWQQVISSEKMVYESTNPWIKELNQKGYAGFHDWRLPTLEELMSLVERNGKGYGMHIDNVFGKLVGRDRRSDPIWTADKKTGGEPCAWAVYFERGDCTKLLLFNSCYFRLVRSGQSGCLGSDRTE